MGNRANPRKCDEYILDKLYTDNGSPYIDKQLALICGSIGTMLLHAPVRDGAAKAKVERNFRSIRERFLYGLDLEKTHSLDELEALLKDYIRSHNISVALMSSRTHLNLPGSSRISYWTYNPCSITLST